MKLDIILRTHDKTNVHSYEQRYCGSDKKILILKCLASLVNSAVLAVQHDISITVLDDHSSADTLITIENILKKSGLPYKIINLEQQGYNYSALKQFEHCRDSNADLAYSVEDDYLHCPSAITEMLDSYAIFQSKLEESIAIYPFDMPDDYVPPWLTRSYIVHGSHRHWRTGVWTTNTFMTTPKVFKKYWIVFKKFATEYNGDYFQHIENRVDESNTICVIWKNHVTRFSPIQSLALHMQFETQKDPYIDWKYWWENYTGY